MVFEHSDVELTNSSKCFVWEHIYK